MAPLIPLFWNENTEPDIARYKFYFGRATGVYTSPGSPVDMGNNLSGTFLVDADGDWFGALTCVNLGNQESGFSGEYRGKFLTGKPSVRT
jgi:hypothetical protein